MPSVQPLLTVRDVVAITRLSRATVFKLISSGELPSFLLRGERRIRPENLTAFLAGAEAATGTPSIAP